MAEGKGRNKNERFQLRLDGATLDRLRRKAAHQGVPINHLIVGILKSEADDTSRYHQQMAAKQSFMSVALLNVLAARLLPADVRKDIFKTIEELSARTFGANPEIPVEIQTGKSADDSKFATELFELFERHAADHWNIKPQ